ncbi:hypothetical protein BDV06DRAFT_119342 [Aspergillus oleicola]
MTKHLPSSQRSNCGQNRDITAHDYSAALKQPSTNMLPPSFYPPQERLDNAAVPRPSPTDEENIPQAIAPSQPRAPLGISHLTEAQCLQYITEVPARLMQIRSEEEHWRSKHEAVRQNIVSLQMRVESMEKNMEDMRRERAEEEQTMEQLKDVLREFLGCCGCYKTR